MTQELKEVRRVIDLIFAVIHFIFTIVLIILLFPININTGIAMGFLSILFTGTFYTYFIKNPFYPYFCIGLLVCGGVLIMPYIIWMVFLLFVGALLNIIFFITLVIELWYISNLTKGAGLSSVSKKVFILRFGGFYGYGGKAIDSFWHNGDTEKKLEEKKARREFEKKYNMYWIIAITLFCSIGFISTLMTSVAV